MIVIISYFHKKIGPLIFYLFPQTQLEEEISNRISEIMDQPKKEEFMIQSFENFKLLNYYFQIYSDWARGGEEMLMLSVMINQQISPEIEETISKLCKKFSVKMHSNKDIFTAFHIKDLTKFEGNDRDIILRNELLIKDWIRDLYWEILEETRKKTEEEKMTMLLSDRYVFESLEKMSREVKKIDIEISKSEIAPKINPNIKNSISILNTIIDDLYKGYIEKMTALDIEEEGDLFTAD